MTANLGIVNGVTLTQSFTLPDDAITGTQNGTWTMSPAIWTTNATAANELHATPLRIPYEREWNGLGLNVTATSAAPGSTATLAVYTTAQERGFVRPDSVIVSATVSVDSTGEKVITIPRVTLTPGVYWLASWSAAAFTTTVTSHTSPYQFSTANHGGTAGTNTTTFRGGLLLGSITELPQLWPPRNNTLARYIRLVGLRATS